MSIFTFPFITQGFQSNMARINASNTANAALTSNSSSNAEAMNYWEGLLASQGQLALDAQLFNSNEAEKNRQWQEYMSNTSYQRAVKDLQKAGLNPILAYQQGGATTPTGGSASVNIPQGDTLTDALNSFAHLISSVSDIGKMISSFLPTIK